MFKKKISNVFARYLASRR